MRAQYELPPFYAYAPKKLKNLAKKVTLEEDANQYNFEEKRVDKAIIKLENKINLRKGEFKILSYRLDEVNKRGMLKRFIEEAIQFYSKTQKMYYHVKALLFSYYKMYNHAPIFKLVRLGFQNNLNCREESNYIKEIIIKSNDIRAFILNIFKEIYECESIEALEHKLLQLMLNRESELLKLILKRKIIESIDDERFKELSKFFMLVIQEYIPQSNYKEIFEKVLLSQKDSDIENLPEEFEAWFSFIGEQLGDPYGITKYKWIDIDEEAKLIFQRWKVLKNITLFFSEISGDPKRLNFWREYSNYFYRVEYFENYDKALLMETKEHLFIEFAKIGALYMYRKDILSIEKLEDTAKNHKKTYIITNILKNTTKCEERLVHKIYWEMEFRRKFEYYGYVIYR